MADCSHYITLHHITDIVITVITHIYTAAAAHRRRHRSTDWRDTWTAPPSVQTIQTWQAVAVISSEVGSTGHQWAPPYHASTFTPSSIFNVLLVTRGLWAGCRYHFCCLIAVPDPSLCAPPINSCFVHMSCVLRRQIKDKRNWSCPAAQLPSLSGFLGL